MTCDFRWLVVCRVMHPRWLNFRMHAGSSSAETTLNTLRYAQRVKDFSHKHPPAEVMAMHQMDAAKPTTDHKTRASPTGLLLPTPPPQGKGLQRKCDRGKDYPLETFVVPVLNVLHVPSRPHLLHVLFVFHLVQCDPHHDDTHSRASVCIQFWRLFTYMGCS